MDASYEESDDTSSAPSDDLTCEPDDSSGEGGTASATVECTEEQSAEISADEVMAALADDPAAQGSDEGYV